jgi:hypothetical protein
MKRKPTDTTNYEGWSTEDFVEDLLTNRRYQAFYKKFKKDTIRPFAEHYAVKKKKWYEKKTKWQQETDEFRMQFLTKADDMLNNILQKKLFDLQCQWRAGLIDLPFIEYSKDFQFFCNHIFDCPFIDPITPEEVAAATLFLETVEDKTEEWYDCWQYYEALKNWQVQQLNQEESDIELPYNIHVTAPPDFYLFYDTHFKKENLLLLPDVREEQEQRYQKAVADYEKAEREKEKPYKMPDEDNDGFGWQFLAPFFVKEFVKEAEDTQTQELFEMKNMFKLDKYEDDTADNMKFLIGLRNLGYNFPFVEATDWHTAIEKTVKSVSQKMTAEMMPYAYDAYLMTFNGDPANFEKIKARRIKNYVIDEEDDSYCFMRNIRAIIAKGKELLGED